MAGIGRSDRRLQGDGESDITGGRCGGPFDCIWQHSFPPCPAPRGIGRLPYRMCQGFLTRDGHVDSKRQVWNPQSRPSLEGAGRLLTWLPERPRWDFRQRIAVALGKCPLVETHIRQWPTWRRPSFPSSELSISSTETSQRERKRRQVWSGKRDTTALERCQSNPLRQLQTCKGQDSARPGSRRRHKPTCNSVSAARRQPGSRSSPSQNERMDSPRSGTLETPCTR